MSIKTYKEIVKEANQLYTNIRTIGHNGMTTKKAYYFAKSVLNPKKDIVKVPIGSAPNPRGKKKGVNIKLTKKEYLERIKYFTSFVEKKKRLPNFIDVKGIHVHPDIWCAYVGYLCKVLAEKGKLPSAQNLQSDVYKNNSIKKHGRSTKYGCDNRGQNNSYYCACHMAQEIIRNLTGVVIPQKTIARVMGTAEDGTGHDGIDTFFAWFNKNYKDYVLEWTWKNFSDVGWKGLKKILESDNQDAGEHELYRNSDGHYTNFDAIYNNTIDVHNSLGDRCDGTCYCGYTENREKSTAESYLNGISQKSILIVTRKV